MKKWLMAIFTFMLLFSSYSGGAFAQDTKNCADFGGSKQAVMDFWFSNGYSATNDPHNLDGDADGYPCEVSKGDWDQYVAQKNAASGGTTTNQGTTGGGTTSGGATMPNTASNDLTLILMSVGFAVTGLFLVLRRKKVNE